MWLRDTEMWLRSYLVTNGHQMFPERRNQTQKLHLPLEPLEPVSAAAEQFTDRGILEVHVAIARLCFVWCGFFSPNGTTAHNVRLIKRSLPK